MRYARSWRLLIQTRQRSTQNPNRFASSDAAPKSSRAIRTRYVVLSSVFALGSSVYVYDRYFNAEALRRSFRTAATGIAIAIDYKLSFTPSSAEQIDAMHQRVADVSR